MPKITSTTIQVYTDKINEKYKVDINYISKESSFVIEVPSQFIDAFDHLSNQDRNTFHAMYYHKTKYHRQDNGKRVVTGKTEAEVIAHAAELFKKLASVSITERNVILVFYTARETNRNHKTSEGYTPTGFDIGLTFCVETTVAGGTKKYYEYSEYEAFGEKRINKKEINIWRDSVNIIDDTEENKKFLITLYKAMDELKNKMDKFTKDEESLLSLISSQQKLLN